MILVTGATGTVGAPLMGALTAMGHKVRPLVQHAADIPASWTEEVEPVVADLDDPASLDVAVAGVDTIYLLVPAHQRMAQYEHNVIEAARQSTERPRVGLHAAAGFDRAPDTVRFAAAHARALAELRASGLAWSVVAPNGFLQNVLGMAAQIRDGVLRLPAGDGAVSYVDAADVADAAAHVLTTTGHDERIYTLTGPHAVTHAEIAERLGAVLGRPVRYEAVTDEQARAASTRNSWLRDGMIELFGVYRSGAAAAVTDDLPDLLGRPGRSLQSYLAANAAAVRAVDRSG